MRKWEYERARQARMGGSAKHRCAKTRGGYGAAAVISELKNAAQVVLKSSRFTPIEARIGTAEHCKQM